MHHLHQVEHSISAKHLHPPTNDTHYLVVNVNGMTYTAEAPVIVTLLSKTHINFLDIWLDLTVNNFIIGARDYSGYNLSYNTINYIIDTLHQSLHGVCSGVIDSLEQPKLSEPQQNIHTHLGLNYMHDQDGSCLLQDLDIWYESQPWAGCRLVAYACEPEDVVATSERKFTTIHYI